MAAFSWFNITDSYIEKIGEYSYRLGIEIDWGGDYIFEGYEIYAPRLDLFSCSIIGNGRYNPTLNAMPGEENLNSPGLWYGYGKYSGLSGNVFGYDFDYYYPGTPGFSIDYGATLGWYANIPLGYTESHGGTFDVYAVPEPATIILFGLGLSGLALNKKRR
jgi:hypothetical protein